MDNINETQGPKFMVGDLVQYENEIFKIEKIARLSIMWTSYTYLLSSTTREYTIAVMENSIKGCLSRKQKYSG